MTFTLFQFPFSHFRLRNKISNGIFTNSSSPTALRHFTFLFKLFPINTYNLTYTLFQHKMFNHPRRCPKTTFITPTYKGKLSEVTLKLETTGFNIDGKISGSAPKCTFRTGCWTTILWRHFVQSTVTTGISEFAGLIN